MGEIAEMMLDGILDASGEYTGRNYGYPVYPRGWFGKKSNYPLAGIHIYMQGGKDGRNIQRKSKKYFRKFLLKYAEVINFPPIGNHQKAQEWDESIAEVITKDFKSFKEWYKEQEKP